MNSFCFITVSVFVHLYSPHNYHTLINLKHRCLNDNRTLTCLKHVTGAPSDTLEDRYGPQSNPFTPPVRRI